MIYSFQCTVYLADGKHISQNEPCDTAKEAVTRAEAWRALGAIAEAHVTVVCVETGEFIIIPLQ